MRDGWELLTDWDRLNKRATRMLQAMAAAAPENTVTTPSYRGRHRRLMLYGPGAAERLPVVRRHVALGGRVAMWDMGYWDRQDSMRLAVDTLHPTAEQLAMAPAEGRREFDLREDADPAGPILLVGIGPKSVQAYGLGVPFAWERRKLAELRQRFPDRAIAWRPKGKRVQGLPGTELRHGMPIEEALRGCSLVVCRHSNVAVDACIAGIPVECEGGAAQALYADGTEPTRQERVAFLRRLSWWEWARTEAPEAWQWIERVTCD